MTSPRNERETRPPIRVVGSLGDIALASLPPEWTTQAGFDLPATPSDLSTHHWICIGTVTDRSTASDAVAAGERGVGLIVAVNLTGEPRRRFLDDLHRIRTARET